MKLFYILILSITIFRKFGDSADYCSHSYTNLCRSYDKKYTLCGAKDDFDDDCPADAKMVPMNNTVLLDFINDKRMLVANGKLRGLKPATKMNRLRWCKELAEIATHTVELCSRRKGFCAQTPSFQNAQTFKKEYRYIDPEVPIDMAVLNKRWQRYKNADFVVLRERRSFAAALALFVHDIGTHVGCAGSRYTAKSDHHYLIACVFSHSPNYLKPYDEGVTASRCTSGIKSDVFEGLCEVAEDELKAANAVC